MDVGGDLDGVVVHEVAVEDGLFGAVRVRLVFEHGEGMRGGRGGEADFHGVEVVEDVFPAAGFFGGVASVAFVGDDDVEGVDGDVELVGVDVVLETAGGVFAEQVDAMR